MDDTDYRILALLQEDATLSGETIAERLGLSGDDCNTRITRLEQSGVVRQRVALLDPGKVQAGVTVFVAIVAPEHSKSWLDRFHATVEAFPEVMEFYRMSGQVDYLLRVVVPDIEAYDHFYKKLIDTTELKDVSSTFAMEQIKFTTALPLASGTAAKS